MLEIRPCRNERDRAVSVEVYNRTWPREAVSTAEAAAWEAGNDETYEALAEEAGRAIGSAVAAIGPPRPSVVFTLITVLPEARRRGAGTALYDAVSVWARERSRETLETRAREEDSAGLDFALHRGFEEISREAGLELRLAGLRPPPVEPPEEIAIETLAERPDLAPALHAVAAESFPDIPGGEDHVLRPVDEWLEQHLYAAGNDPASTFVALADGEAVGYAKLRLSPARPGSAFHGMTAVKRAWRGRGIASALKRAQIAWAVAQGLEVLETTNELRNAPMRAINLKLGYTPAPGRVFLEGPLSGAT